MLTGKRRVVVSCLAWPTSCRRRRPARPTITVMSMKPSAAIRCADALHAMTGDCSSSRFYRARTTASGSAIRHDRQRRHVRLSEPAPPRRVDGDLSPGCLALPQAVVARGANPMLGEDFRPVAWKFRPTPSPTGRFLPHRKEWRRLSTPIDSAGCRRLSPIRLRLTGAAPTSLRSSTPSCAAPPSQRRSQLSHID
jgi:hypothetical protein